MHAAPTQLLQTEAKSQLLGMGGAGVGSALYGMAEAVTDIGGATQEDLASVISKALISTKTNLTADSIDMAFGVASSIANAYNNIDLDSIGNVQGSEVIGSLIALNIYAVVSSSIPFSGDIADLVPVQGGKDNTKFQVISAIPVVTEAVGDYQKGDAITPINAGGTLAFVERVGREEFVTDTLTYVFDVKKSSSDANNYAMAKGTNEVVIGTNVFLNDFDVSSSEEKSVRQVTVSFPDGTGVPADITFTATFDYNAGKITLDVSANILATTPISFIASLDAEDIGAISGAVGTELSENTYVAKPVILNTKVNTLALRQVLQTTGLNLTSNDLVMALNKIAEETKRRKVDYATQFAYGYGATIDIASADTNTIADRYKQFLIAVEEARADITTKSQITSSVVLVGGKALLKLYAGLSTDSNTVNTVADDSNSIRYIGSLNSTYQCFFDPMHDTLHPADAVQGDKVFVIGNPADPTKKASISGVGLPILPEDLGFDTSSKKITSLQGKLVVSYNKDKNARELARWINVKF
jgi:hypothetical protein